MCSIGIPPQSTPSYEYLSYIGLARPLATPSLIHSPCYAVLFRPCLSSQRCLLICTVKVKSMSRGVEHSCSSPERGKARNIDVWGVSCPIYHPIDQHFHVLSLLVLLACSSSSLSMANAGKACMRYIFVRKGKQGGIGSLRYHITQEFPIATG